MKKIICFLLASLLLVLPACSGGAPHDGGSSSEGSASNASEYRIKYVSYVELTLKLNKDNSFTLSGADEPNELEPEVIKTEYGIETSESIKMTEILTLSGTYEIAGDNTVKADFKKGTRQLELQGKDAEKLRSAMLEKCESEEEKEYISGKEVNVMDVLAGNAPAMMMTIKLNDRDRTGVPLNEEVYEEGKISEKTEFEYNENGALIREKFESYGEGEMSFRTETEYDSDGAEVKWSRYDSEGRLTALREFWPNTSDADAKHRENIQKAEYDYDEEGNIVRGYDYDEEGNVIKTYGGH